MSAFSKRLPLFYVFLLVHFLRIPDSVDGRVVGFLVRVNDSETGPKLTAKSILEASFNDSAIDGQLANCTFVANGTNSTACDFLFGNDTWRNATGTNKRDQFKYIQLLLVVAQIAIKVTIFVAKMLLTILRVAYQVGRFAWQALRIAGRFAFKFAQYALRAGKIIGRYVYRAGRLVLKYSDHIGDFVDFAQSAYYDIATPVMDMYQAQEEARRAAQEEEDFRKADLVLNKENWKDESGFEGPEDVGEGEPEWEPQRKTSFLLSDEVDEEGMPGWIVATVVIVLITLIVAMPTAAFVITHRKEIHTSRFRRRRKGAGKDASRTQKSKAKSKVSKKSSRKKSNSTSKSKSKSTSKSKSKTKRGSKTGR